MSLELNKIAAAVLTAGVVAMGSGFVADLLIPEHHGDGENAYPVQVAEAGGQGAPAEEEEQGLQPVLPLMASASAAEGESLTRACAACHSFEQGGPNKVGPNLWNTVGAPHAHIADFAYSDALASIEEPWTYENLNAFLANPREYAPGTKMSYSGMPDVQDRANLIAYLRSLSENPEPLPTEEEIAAVTGGGEAEAAAEEGAAEEPAAEEQPTMEEPAADAAPEGEAEQTAEAEAAAEAEAEAEGAPDQAQQEAAAQAEEAAEQEQAAAQPAEDTAEQPAAQEAAAEEQAADQAGETQQAAADGGAQPEYIQMIAAADPAAGEGAVRACMACHSFNEGGPNKVGPNLWNVVGGPIAHAESYSYSQVFQQMNADGMEWTYENLWAYLKNPREWAPGTKMAYAGVREEQTKAEIIAYLRSLSNDPAPLEPLQ